MRPTPTIPDGYACIYDSLSYQVIINTSRSKTVAVTLSERKEPMPADFFGLSFVPKQDLMHIAVRSLTNDWYLGEDMAQVTAAIQDAIAQSGTNRTILFGFSMGSFGCVRIANDIRPDRMILFGPVATLDPEKERRWMSDYKHLLSASNSCPWPLSHSIDTVAVYDPGCDDAYHADLLRPSTRMTDITIAGAGHMVMSYLRDGHVLGDVTRALIAPDIDSAHVDRLIWQSRKRNKSYLLRLISSLGKRRLFQKMVLAYALERLPNEPQIALAQAIYLSEIGQTARAAQMINQAACHPRCHPTSVALLRSIALYAKFGGTREAIEYALIAIDSHPNRSREAQLWYARFLRFTGAFDAAFAAHIPFSNGDTFEVHTHIERGLIYEQLGLKIAARDSFERACAVAPNFGPARDHLHRMRLIHPHVHETPVSA